MNKIKIIVAGILLALSVIGVQPAFAAPVDDACSGLSSAGVGGSCDSATANNGFGTIVRRIIDILSIVVGAVSVIMIIIGGFRYVISNGDTNGLQGAKNTILYAIVGLVIVLFAQVIARFVITTAKTNPPATQQTRQQGAN